MFENWSIRKKIIIILINSIVALLIIGLIATPIGRSPDIDSSIGSSIVYSLTIILPLLLIRYSGSRTVKITSYIVIIFAVIVSVLSLVSPSSTYIDAKSDLVYSYISKNSLNDCEAQSSPGLYLVGNVDECRYSLYRKNINGIRFLFNEIILRLYSIYHTPQDFLTAIAILLSGGRFA